jgi:hypothetical protein
MSGFPYKGVAVMLVAAFLLSSAGTMSYFHEPEQTSYNVTPGQEIDISMSVCNDDFRIVPYNYRVVQTLESQDTTVFNDSAWLVRGLGNSTFNTTIQAPQQEGNYTVGYSLQRYWTNLDHETEYSVYDTTQITLHVRDQPGIIDKIYIQFEQTILQRIHSMLDMLIVKLGGTV